ncbi:MAG TPA: deoxyribonuclease V [Dongiaceae bacterium]|nr:deoxyribonuclease V [Dongiaceae bacterium]
MRRPPQHRAAPHPWPRDPAAARALQAALAERVSLRGAPRRVTRVAGADVAFMPGGTHLVAAVVVLDFPRLLPVESAVVRRRVRFPYVPGLLSFREAPAILAAFERLRSRPDLLLCDGQGIAHPRRLGLASHLGLLLGIPTVGCAKSRLVGAHAEPGLRRGHRAPLLFGGRQVGWVLRTCDRVRPLYVSPGHRMSLAAAAAWTLACGAGFRLPEPTRLADRLVGRLAHAATIGNGGRPGARRVAMDISGAPP